MSDFNIHTDSEASPQPEAEMQHRGARINFTRANVQCLFIAFGLLLTYLFFLLSPFHWPTLGLFAGLIVVTVLLSFTSWPLAAGWSTLVASAVTLLYGWTYALVYQEYGLLICSALFIVVFVVLRLIFPSTSASKPGVYGKMKVVRVVLGSIMALIVVGVAVLLIDVPLSYGLMYTIGYQEYWLPVCSTLFIVAFVVWRLIFRFGTISMPKVHRGMKVVRMFLGFIMALTIVGAALLEIILPNPKMYLATALSFTEQTAYNGPKVNWPQVNRHALEMIRDARTSQDTYPAINYALSQLQDHHSALWDPQTVNEIQTGVATDFGFLTAEEIQMDKNLAVAYVYPGSAADKAGIRGGDTVNITSVQYPMMAVKWKPQQSHAPERLVKLNMDITYNDELGSNGRRLSGNIGYVNMYGTIADDYSTKEYADKLHHVIRQVDTRPTCGWIVDLRLNQGGYAYPMIQGIGPILGEGKNLLKYVDAQGNIVQGIGYKHGTVLDQDGNGNEFFKPVSNPYQLKMSNPPVAILISPDTASSGEGTVVAFLGRANTRTFGEHTYGVPNALNSIPMVDGAKIEVMGIIDSDRTGKTYQSAIVPDEPVQIDWKQYGTDQDPVMQHAQHWLSSQSTCKAWNAVLA